MFLLGHLGIGSRLARPFVPEARPSVPPNPSYRWLLLGCVLPDLIDKPLYYGLSFATGRHGAALGLISSTRTIGHTLLFALLCFALVRGRRGQALFAGMLTHAALDLSSDLWGHILIAFRFAPPLHPGPSTLAAVLFPLLGPHFPIMPFNSLRAHALATWSGYIIAGESVGAVLLFLDWRAWRKLRARLAVSEVPPRSPP